MLSKQQKNQLESIVKKNNSNYRKKQQKLADLKKRKERYEYAGILSEYQLYRKGQKTFRQLNKTQKLMFNTLIHGYGAYAKEDIKKMSKQEKYMIEKSWNIAQKVINDFKIEVVDNVSNKLINDIFTVYFPKHVKFATSFASSKSETNIMTLSQCGLTYDELVIRFMREKLLPSNFFSLK